MIDWDTAVLAPMMGAGIFGEALQPLYTPQGGGTPFNLDGVFDDAYVGLSIEGAEPEFQTLKPVLGVRLAQIPAGVTLTAGDSVFIPSKSTTYKVMSVEPDGHGWVLLELMTTGAP